MAKMRKLFYQTREDAVLHTMRSDNCSRQSAEQVVDVLTNGVNLFLNAYLKRSKRWQN